MYITCYVLLHIFRMQKRAIRITTGCRSRESCRNLFKKLKILPLKSKYIFSLLLFVVNNKDRFMVNSKNYSINTRQNTNFHLPHANLAIYQKGAYYLSIKIFNNLPSDIKNLSDTPKKFTSFKELFT
jgi:hypothetical protein